MTFFVVICYVYFLICLLYHITYLEYNDFDIIQKLCWLNCVCILTVNVAFNKPTYQQYPFKPGEDTYDSSNAVDGNISDLAWNGGQCAFSLEKETATWWVNLTSIHSIHHITIYFRTENIPWGIHFRNLSIYFLYISNQLYYQYFLFLFLPKISKTNVFINTNSQKI